VTLNLETLHPALAKVQWIDFNQHGGDFYANFSELVRTLDTDRDHVQSHTKWSQRALEWQEKEKTKDLLLRGSELNIAESWLWESEAENKQPPATDLQKEFIAKSRRKNEIIDYFKLGQRRQFYATKWGGYFFWATVAASEARKGNRNSISNRSQY
jgi:hypothetical protein